MTMREPVIRGIQVASVIELWLVARVEQHRMHAVLVWEREVENLEVDRDDSSRSVRLNFDAAAIAPRLPDAIDVALDPDRLILRRQNRHGQAPASRPRVFRHELHRLPTRRIRRSGRTVARVYPRRM